MLSKLQVKVIDSLFADYNRLDSPGLAIGVIKDGHMIFSNGYGSANLEYHVPITENTTFHAASIAKQFTAMAVALLEEQGLVDQDDDIRKYLPELPQYPWPISVGNLIHMTNGLVDFYGLMNFICGIRENEHFSKAEAWRAIKACDWLLFEPGTSWRYSNTGYFLLAELVERVSGLPLAQFTDLHIFKPLGMTDTFFRDDRTKIIPRRAESYSDYAHVHFNGDKKYCSQGDRYSINTDLMEIPGAGQIWTTVLDLAKWDANFYNNRLGRGTSDLITKVTTRAKLKDGKTINYGYGLYLNNTRGLDYVSHPGWANGYSAIIHRIPCQRLTVIALGNLTSLFWDLEVDPGTDCAVDKIIQLVLGKELYSLAGDSGQESQESSVLAKAEDLTLYCGYYQRESSLICEVFAREGILAYRDLYDREYCLVAWEHGYTSEGSEIQLFIQNGQLYVTENGQPELMMPFVNEVDLRIYEGTYACPRLNTRYNVIAEVDGIRLRNANLRDSAMEFCYKPSIRDSFYCQAKPYFPWCVVSFTRNAFEEITGFVFQDDDGSTLDKLVFERVEDDEFSN